MAEVCRWGILSTAGIAQKNWQAMHFADNATCVAVASRDIAKAEAFIADCQSQVPFAQPPTALGSYEEIINHSDVDAVYIPLPTGVRKEWVIAAANAGKHVLCEKPCAIAAADLQEMIDACNANNVQFMDGVMYMHSERLTKIREVIDAGKIGDIRRISTQFSFCAPEEFMRENIRTSATLEPDGCVGDLGWYCIRFALWVMGYQMPESVSGRMLASHDRDGGAVPMEFSGELVFPGGVSHGFYCSFRTEHQHLVNINGTKGYILYDDFVLPFFGNELYFTTYNSEFVVDRCNFNMERHCQTHAVSEYGNSHKNSQETKLIEKFSSIVQSGKLESHWPEISLKTQQVMDAVLADARSK